MSMSVTFHTSNMSPQLMIDIANAISADIDRLAIDSQSLDSDTYHALKAELVEPFDILCAAIESGLVGGLELSDVVVCPKYL